VAPLDDDAPMYAGDPLIVRLSGVEAGTSQPQVALVHLIAAARLDRFEAVSVGRLSSRSMGLVNTLLRTVLRI
jgi:mRNA-degrading endonuclease toxin of MazEF toxin-antitoxin module